MSLTPLAAVVLVFQSVSPAPQTPATTTTAVAQRATTAPAIDGKDDDAVWRLAQGMRGFRQFSPTEDGEPTVTTEVKVAYDDHNFYAFVRAFDPHPDSIKSLLARRDVRICCDQIKITIDSYHDRRTGFEFAVSPGGVKRDYAIYGDGEQEDEAWDAVWEVGTQVDSLGWTAEFRIPLSQLRYPHAATNTFGFGVWRDIDRRGGERVSWPLFRRSRRGFPSQLGEVVGLEGLAAPQRLELAPYVVVKNEPAAGFTRDQSYDAGADVKFGITSNITVDATINPDFGQVESDPSVVNLSSFATFYEERRPFFVEGTGIFNFPVNCSVVNCSGENLFYSRRIGHDPSRIIGAAKITGRLPGGLSIGAVEGLTRRASFDSITLEPLTNYGVVRISQDFRKGQSGVGFMATAVNRNVDRWTDTLMHGSAYAGALDFRHRFHGGTYELSGSVDLSTVRGTPQVIAATQQNFTHNYQRPDDGIAFDPNRTSLSGSSQEILFGKQNGFFVFQTSYQRRSPGFELNDLGFLLQSDQQSWNNWAAFNWTKPTKLFQRANWNFNWWQFWTTNGLANERAANTNAHFTFNNQWSVHFGGTVAGIGGVACDCGARGGPAWRRSPAIYPWIGFVGDQRSPVQPILFFNYGKGDDGHSTSFSVQPEIDLRISSRFTASISLDARHNINDMQDLPADTGQHFRFAHIDQQQVRMVYRVNYTVTPTLTVQVYAQPFVSKARWSNLRELSSTPRADAYDDRLQPYADSLPLDFNRKFFNSNFVVRWEYRPGSTLFLVWNQGRADFEDVMGTRNVRGDFQRLFDAYPRNTFLIKASYWLNR